MSILLPDVSEFQSGGSAPDWAGIKTKNGGAGIIRVGYGDAHLDHMFVNNYTALKTHGYKFMGLYHYLRRDQDPAVQAAQFCKWVGPKTAVAPGTVFILDLEEGDGNQAGRANTWLTHVDQFYGLDKKPLNERSWLYSYTTYVTVHGLGAIFASTRHTWIAAYQNSPPVIGHTLWQSTDGQNGSNITNWPGCGRCDTSIHNGTLATLSVDAWPGVVDTPPAGPSWHGEYVTAGMFNLADLCARVLGHPSNTVLRMTAVHYGAFDPILADYINDVFTGQKPSTAPVPQGAKIWVD